MKEPRGPSCRWIQGGQMKRCVKRCPCVPRVSPVSILRRSASSSPRWMASLQSPKRARLMSCKHTLNAPYWPSTRPEEAVRSVTTCHKLRAMAARSAGPPSSKRDMCRAAQAVRSSSPSLSSARRMARSAAGTWGHWSDSSKSLAEKACSFVHASRARKPSPPASRAAESTTVAEERGRSASAPLKHEVEFIDSAARLRITKVVGIALECFS